MHEFVQERGLSWHWDVVQAAWVFGVQVLLRGKEREQRRDVFVAQWRRGRQWFVQRFVLERQRCELLVVVLHRIGRRRFWLDRVMHSRDGADRLLLQPLAQVEAALVAVRVLAVHCAKRVQSAGALDGTRVRALLVGVSAVQLRRHAGDVAHRGGRFVWGFPRRRARWGGRRGQPFLVAHGVRVVVVAVALGLHVICDGGFVNKPHLVRICWVERRNSNEHSREIRRSIVAPFR